MVQNTRTQPGALLETDHVLLCSKIRNFVYGSKTWRRRRQYRD